MITNNKRKICFFIERIRLWYKVRFYWNEFCPLRTKNLYFVKCLFVVHLGVKITTLDRVSFGQGMHMKLVFDIVIVVVFLYLYLDKINVTESCPRINIDIKIIFFIKFMLLYYSRNLSFSFFMTYYTRLCILETAIMRFIVCIPEI